MWMLAEVISSQCLNVGSFNKDMIFNFTSFNDHYDTCQERRRVLHEIWAGKRDKLKFPHVRLHFNFKASRVFGFLLIFWSVHVFEILSSRVWCLLTLLYIEWNENWANNVRRYSGAYHRSLTTCNTCFQPPADQNLVTHCSHNNNNWFSRKLKYGFCCEDWTVKNGLQHSV